MSAFTGFGDESGIHRQRSPVYSIGCLVVESASVPSVEAGLEAILQSHGVPDELKWTKVGGHRARADAAEEGLRFLFQNKVRYFAIVVRKDIYQKWRTDREEAFYTTYYLLAKQMAERLGDIDLRIDERVDRYSKRGEVMRIVSNNALRRIGSPANVASVEMIDSKASRILQFADLLTGAINADTSSLLLPGAPVNDGKRELITRIAAMFGWKRLYHDTYPNSRLNLWHFPIEFRNVPGTRNVPLDLGIRAGV